MPIARALLKLVRSSFELSQTSVATKVPENRFLDCDANFQLALAIFIVVQKFYLQKVLFLSQLLLLRYYL